MNATVGKGKAVHSTTETGSTRCGAEFGAGSRNGKTSSALRSIDHEVTCKKCQKLADTSTSPAPVVPQPRKVGPNARQNFEAMMKNATSAAGRVFWARKLSELSV